MEDHYAQHQIKPEKGHGSSKSMNHDAHSIYKKKVTDWEQVRYDLRHLKPETNGSLIITFET